MSGGHWLGLPFRIARSVSLEAFAVLRDYLEMFRRDPDETVPRWILSRTLFGVFVIPLMLIGLLCYFAAAAIVIAIIASFVFTIGWVIINGQAVSDEVPNETAFLGLLAFLAGLMIADEGVERLGLMFVGVLLGVGAFIY